MIASLEPGFTTWKLRLTVTYTRLMLVVLDTNQVELKLTISLQEYHQRGNGRITVRDNARGAS